MLAYLDHEDERCPSCGLPRDECQAQEAEGTFESHAIRCHATKAREVARDAFVANKGDTRGLLFGIRKR